MPQWIFYALLAALFAGLTSVIAKQGLTGITAELGLTVRTCFVFVFVLLFAAGFVSRPDFAGLNRSNLGWLGLSGITTAASWVFYYKALKEGDVSTVALLDKGSFLVAVLLSWLILGEKITARTLLGGAFIATGLWIVSRK